MNKFKVLLLEGTVFLILAQVMVGINIVFSKYVLSTVPIMFVLATRFALAAAILLPLHWLTSARKKSIYSYFTQLNKRDWLFIFAQALCAGIFFNFLMLLGLRYTDANVAGIITSALPALIAIMSWLILGEKISSKKMICVFFATVGLVIIAWNQFHGVDTSHSFLGDIIIFLSLFPEATYYILCKIYTNSLPIFLMSSILNAINAILLFFILAIYSGIPLDVQFSDWIILFILGLSSGFFYVFWYFGCQNTDGMMASLSTAIMPVATVLIAWTFLGEQLTFWQAIGMSMILLSIVTYAKKSRIK